MERLNGSRGVGVRIALLVWVVGCDGGAPIDPGCRCEGDVPEGTLSVACGEAQCVGGVRGYRCTAANTAADAPEACDTIDPDAGVDPCACDVNAGCDEGCACDTACTATCACDVSAACDVGCSCDPECLAEEGCPDWTRNDGYCDCGCGEPDPDCPSPALDDCQYVHCLETERVDPSDPTRCTALPAGWTCPGSWLSNGYCDCGCGIADDECEASFTVDDCLVPNGCDEGSRPDPSDPTQCIANPAGWTCEGLLYDDGSCTCGCGIADPDCPSPTRVEACRLDGCPSGEGPSPRDPTECIANPPQDDWTCDDALLFDGSVCDCGCGAIDPDCESEAASSCDVVHCAARDELDPESIALCRERCSATSTATGSATCTNGGMVSFGGFACTMNLSACSDGHRYQVECGRDGCLCRVDSACVRRASDASCGGSVSGTLNSACGWSLIDAR
jgi:hypothetical protein